MDAESECDVFKYVQMRKQSVSLKNGVYVAFIRRQVVYSCAHKAYVALVGFNKAADYTKRSRFAAARGTQQGDKFLVVNVKGKIFEYGFAVKAF